MTFSAINFLMIHRVEIAGIFLILGIINYISYVIYDKLAKRKFMTLCTLFVEKFGARPAEVLIYQDGGSFSRLCVMHSLLMHYTLKKTHSIHEEWIMNKYDSLKHFLISIPIGYV